MSLQVVQARELQVTLRAGERLFARVQNAVSPLGTGVREGLATYATGVGLLSSMDSDVGLKRTLCCERFATDFTSKWLLTCVCS